MSLPARHWRRSRWWNGGLVGALVAVCGVGYLGITQPQSGRNGLGTVQAMGGPEGGGSGTVVSEERLVRHVRALSEQFVPRSHEDVENLDRAATYIAEAFREAGLVVTEQPYTTVYGQTYRNVIARVPSRDVAARALSSAEEEVRHGIVIVGAHYDAYLDLPGADDNASGVAGLLELARMLAANPPDAAVELVAFNTEEPPYFSSDDMGSARHAESLKQRGVKVRGMMALETIGYFSDAKGSQTFPLPLLRLMYPTTGNYITVVGRTGQGRIVRRVKRAMRGATDLRVESINAPRSVPGLDFSDHAPYWDRGFEAVMITDTAFYRNPRYHTADDTWDTLDYARMAKVVQGVFAAVHRLAAE